MTTNAAAKELNRFDMSYFFSGAHFRIVNQEAASVYIDKIIFAHRAPVEFELEFSYRKKTETFTIEVTKVDTETGSAIYPFKFAAKIITPRFKNFRLEGYYKIDSNTGGFALYDA